MKSLDRIIFKYGLALLCAAFAGGCGEEGRLGLDKVDDIAPAADGRVSRTSTAER